MEIKLRKRLIYAGDLWHKTFDCEEPGDFRKAIENAPTVDAVEVVHGRWVEHRPNVYECTACHTWYGNYGGCEEWAYCPNCGAKMDGGKEGK